MLPLPTCVVLALISRRWYHSVALFRIAFAMGSIQGRRGNGGGLQVAAAGRAGGEHDRVEWSKLPAWPLVLIEMSRYSYCSHTLVCGKTCTITICGSLAVTHITVGPRARLLLLLGSTPRHATPCIAPEQRGQTEIPICIPMPRSEPVRRLALSVLNDLNRCTRCVVSNSRLITMTHPCHRAPHIWYRQGVVHMFVSEQLAD